MIFQDCFNLFQIRLSKNRSFLELKITIQHSLEPRQQKKVAFHEILIGQKNGAGPQWCISSIKYEKIHTSTNCSIFFRSSKFHAATKGNPLKTNECPLKMDGWKMYSLLKLPLFRRHSFVFEGVKNWVTWHNSVLLQRHCSCYTGSLACDGTRLGCFRACKFRVLGLKVLHFLGIPKKGGWSNTHLKAEGLF